MKRFDSVRAATAVVIALGIPAGCGGLAISDGEPVDASVPVAGSGGTPGGGGSGSGGSGGVGGIGGTQGSGAAVGIGGVGGVSGSAGSAGTGGQPTCSALLAGTAVELISSPTQHSTGPVPALLSELSPPRVALQLITGASNDSCEMQLARFATSESSPSGIQPELPSMPLGSVASGWGAMAHAPGNSSELALAWVSGPAGNGWPVFRRVGIKTWSASPTVDLAPPPGKPLFEIAAGEGLTASGTGYGGGGYAVIWRRPAPTNPLESVVAILDATGLPVLGPLVVTPLDGIPTVIWSGSTYLTATPLPQGIQLGRVRPPSGAAGDVGAVEPGVLIPPALGMDPRRAMMRRLGPDVIVAWQEKPTVGSTPPERVRVARVSADGSVILDPGPSLPVAAQYRPTVELDGDHVVLTWVEVGDASLADNMVGRDKIVVVRLPPDLKPPGAWAQILTTKFYAHGPPRTISRGTTGSLLTVWAGRSKSSGLEVVYGARSDCS